MTAAGAWLERFFDAEYARLWGDFASGDDEARSLWRILDLGAGSKVLDAGCGFGRVSLPLAHFGASVLGVDQSAVLLEEAERRRGDLGTERLRFLRHDLRVPIAESGFDVALSLFSSLGYGTDDEDAAIFRTLYSALRPGGRVAVVSETFARKVFGGPGNAIGKTFQLGDDQAKQIRIVGVARDIKAQSVRDQDVKTVWLPVYQNPQFVNNLAVRVKGDPSQVATAAPVMKGVK